MTNTKRTKKIVLGEILEIQEIQANEEYKALIEKLIEQTDRKNVNKGLTENQKANEGLKEIIVARLAEQDRPITITELQETDERLAGLSNQKISALLKQLKDTNAIVKTIDKKKAYFSIAD